MEIDTPKQLDTSTWLLLGNELWKRTVFPVFHFSFVIFFVFGVIGFCGLGVWFEIIGDHSTQPTQDAMLRTALLATFPALIGTSCMQLIWSELSEKYLKTFAMGILIVSFVVALLGSRPRVTDIDAIWAYAIATIFSLWVWWMANAYQNEFLDHDPQAPTGGDAGKPKLPGSLTGYKT